MPYIRATSTNELISFLSKNVALKKTKTLYGFHVECHLEHMYERSCSVRQSRDAAALGTI